jgi:hypothetical protein
MDTYDEKNQNSKISRYCTFKRQTNHRLQQMSRSQYLLNLLEIAYLCSEAQI